MSIPIEFVILGMIVIFLMVIMVVGVEHTVPMYVRANFDDICNSYLAVIERDGGLSTAQRDTMKAELNQLGITNIAIDAPVYGTWGQHVTFKVEGEYVFESTEYRNLSKANEAKQIIYQNSTVILCLD